MTGKVVWLGDGGDSDFFKANAEAEPVAVGGIVDLEQAQVTDLEARGHRFAKVNSEEGQEARKALKAGETSPLPAE